MVISLKMLGERPGGFLFTFRFILKTDRVGADWNTEPAPHQGADSRGVYAARKKGANRYIGDHAAANAADQNVFQLVGQVGKRTIENVFRWFESKETAADAFAGRRHAEPFSGAEFFDVSIDRARRSNILKAKQFTHCVEIDG